ncbi:ATP-binding protein [Bacteroides caecigallinarum]|uniref:AAA family ATPase n=1 Tax=Candidatus Phocaeicola faecigallinarum TaxID=2838732 RepID=A0A948TDA7_9BACT|nr:AAA family ATPase [Bacteroides caecigallinarum]MBU3838789.1 AAA family ATPase [Candidatus Phocaeicola faecigallinarum]MCF2580851.1 AAA family ATPase [Bacteroides caecigallinarum]
MLKRKIDTYLTNYYATNRNALLITGARQIGKTYSIREFGRTFKSFIEINFLENPDAVALFKGAKNSSDILLRLSAITTKPLIKGETLIFFDEVQKCPDIVTAIKFLVDEGSYRYILSGSLLGVELNDLRSEPVGYMGVKDMYPMDFEEFISCVGINQQVIDSLRTAWQNRTPVDEFVHSKIMELFRLYLVVGGMPAAVSKYIETNNLQEVMAVQKDIIKLYKRDIAQYDSNNKLSIEEIFDLIPPELNAKNKRFILKRLNENAKFERYQNSFLWLKNAGVALPVYNIEEPKLPLLLSRSRNLFKLFQSDIGLLAAQYAEGIQLRIISGDKSINFGSVFENAVAQELVAHGIDVYYYNNKKRGELDFVIELAGKVLPIEVKSGKDYEVHRALTNIMDCSEYEIPESIIFNNDNINVRGKYIYAPIYMVMFIEKKNDAPTFYKVDLSGLN